MQDYRVQQAQIYTDFSGLNALKSEARTDKKAALEVVARQFESLFLAEMLKSMRKAGEVFSEGNFLHSSRSDFYQELFDSQLSLTMANTQGTGLAEVLVRQLSRQVPGLDSEGNRLAGHRSTLADYDRSLPALSPALPEQVRKLDTMTIEVRPGEEGEGAAALPERFDSPEQFVQTLLPIARRVAADSGIDPRLMVAQAALETGWGRYMIEGDDARPSFNLFGIKADDRWSGDSVTLTTTEFRGGRPMKERADFRAYPDYEASFRDYVDFLEANPRYRDVLAVADQPAEFAHRLQAAGYATDPDYGHKINRIMAGASLTTLTMDETGLAGVDPEED